MIFRCPHCRVSVRPSEKDCPSCRQPMLKRCETCREDISILATLCKYCGDEFENRPAPQPQPDIVFLEEPSSSVAWETKGGVFSRWWRTMLSATFHPRRFMRSLPREGGYAKPIAFVYMMFVQALLVAVVVLAIAGFGAAVGGEQLAKSDIRKAAVLVLVSIPLGYVASAAWAFLASGFWHLMARLAGSKAGFQSTFRMISYASGTMAWGLIPGVGKLVQLVSGSILLYHGFRRVHGLTRGRALLAFAMPVVLGLAAMAVITAVAIVSHAG